ncbi:MAG: hypothetical protein K2X81_17065, partial [Candidatus Obscuribacterales bacterium]|nr:hypothetical protein [Candidatus Obscuribacterales bacterium]
IYAVLDSLNKDQRTLLEAEYRKRFGIKLGEELKGEMSGAELDKALNLLSRPDGKADDAGRIHTDLIERAQIISGRNNNLIEADLRTTISTMNSAQLDALKSAYKQRYGQELQDTIAKDSKLSTESKQFIEVYLKGTEKRSSDDTMRLADIALKSHNLELFAEAFRNATPADRERFAREGGSKRIETSFPNQHDAECAKQYLTLGKLSNSQQVKDNSSILGDNEKAIENTLAHMSAKDRESYLWGKFLNSQKDGAQPQNDYDKQAIAAYKELNGALRSAANDTELARWEDMIAQKGGGLISKLAEQRGILGHHSRDEVMSVIENMNQQDWQRLKQDADYRKDLNQVMQSFLNKEELQAANKIIDNKLQAPSFEQASSAKRQLIEIIGDANHWYHTDKGRIITAIAHMSSTERSMYQSSVHYREHLDKALDESMGNGPLRESARYMLDQIKHGKPAVEDIITSIYEKASALDVDESAVITDLQRALREHPEMRERILHPKSAEDLAFTHSLQKALKTALNNEEFDRYIAPLFLTGDIPVSIQIDLHKGVFSDNKERIFDSFISAPPYERAMLLSRDPNNKAAIKLQNEVFSSLNADERQLAELLLRQKDFRPEDKLRMVVLGASNNIEEIKSMLSSHSEEERRQIVAAYERKFAANLNANLAELKAEIQAELAPLVRSTPLDARQEFNLARDRYNESRTGLLGRALVDGIWDGTGLQLDEAISGYARAMAKTSSKFAELSRERREELASQVADAVCNYRQSKEAAADMAVDAVITAAALIAAPETGGVSLAYLLAASGMIGSVTNLSIRAAAMGENYDWRVGAVGKDVLRGFVSGASSIFGPAEVAKMFKVGEQAAAGALRETLSNAASEGLDKVMKPGAEKILSKEINHLIHGAIADGKNQMDNASLWKVAEKAIAKDLDEETRAIATQNLSRALRHNLNVELRKESEAELGRALKAIAYNTAAATASGALGGVTESAMRLDGNRSIGENIAAVLESAATGAALGAAMAGGISTGRALGSALISKMSSEAGKEAAALSGDWYLTDRWSAMLDYKMKREYKIDGRNYDLFQRVENSPWFYGKIHSGDSLSHIKVEVTAHSATELGEIQKVLLPALAQEHSPINKLAGDFKTLDPLFGSGDWNLNEWKRLPDGKRYDGVAFSISAKSPEDAAALQKEIDSLLTQKGLKTPESGLSVRLNTIKEHFQPAFDEYDNLIGAKLDADLEEGLHHNLGIDSRQKLSTGALREIEKRAGVEPGLLCYDKSGHLALRDLNQSGKPQGALRLLMPQQSYYTLEEHPFEYYL